jgi:fructose-1,6-bisphosphatase/inositol monophosphatase family enzyme
VETKLRAALAKFDPAIAFGGEESSVDYMQKTFWLVDPIDGTEHFTRGISGCTNMAALVDNGEPVMSIIYDFVHDEWYAAFKNHGATCNGQKLHVSKRPLSRAWVNFSSGFAAGQQFDSASKLLARDRLARICTLVHSVEAGRLVASGKIEGYVAIDGNGKPWDYVPRTFLIKEAGGMVTKTDGSAYDFLIPNFIAASPVIYDDILKALNN